MSRKNSVTRQLKISVIGIKVTLAVATYAIAHLACLLTLLNHYHNVKTMQTTDEHDDDNM